MAEWLDELIAAIHGGPENLPLPHPMPTTAPTPDLTTPQPKPQQRQQAQRQVAQQAQAGQGNYWDGVKHALQAVGQLGMAHGATAAQTQQHEQNYAANQAPKSKPAPKKPDTPAKKPATPSKPAAQPSGSGKQRQIAQYKGEQAAVDREPSLPVGPGVSLSARDVGEMFGDVMDPRKPLRLPGSTKADRMARSQRIASGQENWQPIVGKTTAADKQKYKDLYRQYQQNERGIFGQRLSEGDAKTKQQLGALRAGEVKLKTGERLTSMEQKALIKAGKIPNPDPAASDDAATIGTLESMAPGLAVGEALAPALRARVFGGGRLAKAGEAIKGRFSRGATAEEVDAKVGVKPPAGEAIGKDIPKNGKPTTTAQTVTDTNDTLPPARTSQKFAATFDKAKPRTVANKRLLEDKSATVARGAKPADEPKAEAATRPPLPKTEEKPAKPSRAAQAAKKQRADEVNAKTQGPATAETSAQKRARNAKAKDALDKMLDAARGTKKPPLDKADTAARARQARADKNVAAAREKDVRGNLTLAQREAFDRMTPAQQRDFVKQWRQDRKGQPGGVTDQARKIVADAKDRTDRGEQTDALIRETSKNDPAIKAARSKLAKTRLEYRAQQKAAKKTPPKSPRKPRTKKPKPPKDTEK